MKTFKTAFLMLSLLAAIGPFLPAHVSSAAAGAASESWILEGTVYYSTSPVPGIQLSLFDQDLTQPPIAVTVSDGAGHYALSIPAGPHQLRVAQPGSDWQTVIYILQDSSTPGTFTLDIYLRKILTILQPQSGTVLITSHPTFCWEPLAEAASYTLQIILNSGSLVEYQTNLTSTCYETAYALQVGSTYVWLLSAYDAGGREIGFNDAPVAYTFQIHTPLFLPLVGR